MLVNDMIHGLYPEAVSIGEDVCIYSFLFGLYVDFKNIECKQIEFFVILCVCLFPGEWHANILHSSSRRGCGF